MSSSLIDGPPEAKKFRMGISCQDENESSSGSSDDTPGLTTLPTSSLEGMPLTGEAPHDGQSPGAPSSARSSNGSVTSTGSNEKDDEADMGMTGNLLEMISKSLLGNIFKVDEMSAPRAPSLSPSPAPQAQTVVVPGAVAVAQTPAAQLFSEEDWSWHRNPAAAIRSGGTNKQTPVWKYFVYNKVENLSRCIVGDCTYMLKGPHTSTLACHLKKHPNEYAEFQKLKAEYTRDRHGGQMQSSPSSSSSTASQTARPPKNKKENRNGLEGLTHTMRVGQTSEPTSMPNLVQNLMTMNPLQFMMNQQQKQAATANVGAAQAASQMLQQAGLAVSTTGQIMQSKKWRRDERRQRELESRLALALAASHIPLQVLTCPLWKELMEAAQPKFTFPEETSSMEQLLTTQSSRLIQSVRSHLSSSKKFCIILEIVRFTSPSQDDPVTRISVSASFHAYHGSKVELRTVLLAFRPLAETTSEAVRSVVDQVLLEYDSSMENVSRVLFSGVQYLSTENKNNVFENQMSIFSISLFSAFNHFIDNSAIVEELRKAVFTLIFSFVTKPDALQALNKATGDAVDLPLTDPFPLLAEAVLTIKDAINSVCEQGLVSSNLDEQQWALLKSVHSVYCLFRQACSGDVSTIDGAIPALKQLEMTLDRDASLSSISSEIRKLIGEKMAFITDINSVDFDGSFIKATSLNPQLVVLLNEDQIGYAKNAIKQQLCTKLRSQTRSFGVDELLVNVINQSKLNAGNSGEISSNQLYADMLQQANERLQQEHTPAREQMAEAITSSYFDEVLSGCSVESLLSPFGGRSFGNPFQPPIQFWIQAASHCPQLSEIATELLSIPASPPNAQSFLSIRPLQSLYYTADTGPIFSHLDKPERFERDLLLRTNRGLLPKSY